MRIRDEDTIGEPEFSMAPLIDIVFQLLIFFMLATTYQKSERQLDVELPRAQSGEKSAAIPDEIVVDVTRDGRWFVGGLQVERDGLIGALESAAKGRNETPVMVRGDRLASHENVVVVLDACGIAGLQNLAVGTLDGVVHDGVSHDDARR